MGLDIVLAEMFAVPVLPVYLRLLGISTEFRASV